MAQPNLSGVDPDIPGRITIHRRAGSTASDLTSGTALSGIPYTIQLVRLRDDIDRNTADLTDPNNFVVIPLPDGYTRTVSTNTLGVADFPNLPHGIFLVEEGTHSITPEEDRVAPFIVGIPRRDAAGTGWIYEVDVFPKIEEDVPISFTKTGVLAWDSDLGDLVATWEFEVAIPRLVGNASIIEFWDELDPRLTFIPDSVVGTYYRLEEVEGTPTPEAQTLPSSVFSAAMVGGELNIQISEGIDYLAEHALTAPHPNGILRFTFQTRVAMPTVENADQLGPITNAARFYYHTHEALTAEATVTQFALEVEKVDVNNDRLAGAEFELFLDAAGTEYAFPNSAGVNRRMTTDANGHIFMPGLTAGTFYLREMVAPPGFALISTPMPVTISVQPGARSHVVEVQVVNEIDDGFTLPETGGAGTLLFTAGGLILVGGAITLFLIAKRRRREQGYD